MLPLIHIGFPKTGTTTLQKALFARHPQVFNLGEPNEDADALAAVAGAWASCDHNKTKRKPIDVDRARARWCNAIDRCPPGCVPVFSKETLLLDDFYDGPSDACLPKTLHAVIGPARIMIVIRQQLRMIESLYLFQAKGPHYRHPESWVEEQSKRLDLLQFNTICSTWARIFGRENVCIFLFEDLVSGADNFARRVCSFAGIDPVQGAALIHGEKHNARISQRYFIYSQLRKRLGLYVPVGQMFPRWVRNRFNRLMRGGGAARIELPAPLRNRLADRYRADNRKLAAEWQLPLLSHQYPV